MPITSHTAGTLHDLMRKDNRDLKPHHIDYALNTLAKAGEIAREKIGSMFVYPTECEPILRKWLQRQGHLPRPD